MATLKTTIRTPSVVRTIVRGMGRPGESGAATPIAARSLLGNASNATALPVGISDPAVLQSIVQCPSETEYDAFVSLVGATFTTVDTALAARVLNTDGRLTDAREWTASTITQTEAEAGTATTRRAFTAERVRQAIVGWWTETQFENRLGVVWDATTNDGEVALYCDDRQWFFSNATLAQNFRNAIGAGTSNFNGLFSSLAALPSTLAGYGINDAQPLNANLTAIAALTTTAFGRSLLTQADGPATRAMIGAIGGSLGATANRVLVTNGTGGATAQASPVTIDGSGNVTGVAGLTASGAATFSNIVNIGSTDCRLFRDSGNLYIESDGAVVFRDTSSSSYNMSVANGVLRVADALGKPMIAPSYDGNLPNHFPCGLVVERSSIAIGLAWGMYQDNSASWSSGWDYASVPRTALMNDFNGLRYIATASTTATPGTVLSSQPTTVFSVSPVGAVKISANGTPVTSVLSATATLDFPSIATNDTHTLTITVTGAAAGDSVCLGIPAGLDAGLIFCASVTAADTVTIRMHNSTGGSVDPASATFRATVIKF